MAVSKHRKKSNYYTTKHTHVKGDLRKQNRLTYDELNHSNIQIGQLLSLYASFIPTNVTNNDNPYELYMPYLEDPSTVTEKINLLAKDLSVIIPRYNEITLKHSNKSGVVKTQEEQAIIIEIAQEYTDIMTLVDSVLTPTFTYIHEEFRKAELKYNDKINEISSKIDLAGKDSATLLTELEQSN